ncbi:MAG: TetR/AcrR family transcriptional regulator [Actinomycetota bacterium]
MATPTRSRNAKGEGGRLRTDLLDAAADLLAEEGDVVSLRAIAARAGVSPTAVYRHFDDHLELLRAAVRHCWAEFERALVEPGEGVADAVLAFRASGEAYLRFAEEQPGKYRVLFANKIDLGMDDAVGSSAFEHLVGQVAAILHANGDPRDPRFVAVQVHTWIHGMVDLIGRHPDGDWPSTIMLLDELGVRLGLTTGDATP